MTEIKKGEQREVARGMVRDRSLYRRSFNLYHCILSDLRNSHAKFISHHVTERGRLFTVIVRCVLKFNNEYVVNLTATLRIIRFLAMVIYRVCEVGIPKKSQFRVLDYLERKSS